MAIVLYKLLAVVAVLASAVWLRRVIRKWNPPGDATTDEGIRKLLTVILYLVVFLALLTIFGVPFSSLSVILGGLSAGLAFAAKDFIGNIFGAITLFTERPFSLGDTVYLSNHCGEVKEIGTRTTLIGKTRIPNQVFTREPFKVEKKND